MEAVEIPQVERAVTQEQRLKWVFGEGAKIEPETDGWSVELTLSSRGIVTGGQRINLDLSSETTTEMTDRDQQIQIGGVYLLENFKVNGKVVNFPYETVFLPISPQPPPSPLPYGTNSEQERLCQLKQYLYELTGEEALADTSLKRILITELTSAEELAGLCHEVGHLEGKSVQGDNRVSFNRVIKNLEAAPANHVSEWDTRVLEASFKEEKRANINGLAWIRQKRKEGKDLFPNDPDLVGVSLLYNTQLSTYLGSGLGANIEKQVDRPNQYLDLDSTSVK